MTTQKRRRRAATRRRSALLSTTPNDKRAELRTQRRYSAPLAGLVFDDAYMVGIDPTSKKIRVVPWPSDLPARYLITFGCNDAEPLRGTVMNNFNAALRWGVDRERARHEFSKIIGFDGGHTPGPNGVTVWDPRIRGSTRATLRKSPEDVERAVGRRSDVLYRLCMELHEVGLSEAEILCLLKASAWAVKFAGRRNIDELLLAPLRQR